MVTIAQAVKLVKDDPAQLLAPALESALSQHSGFVWRQRIFDPLTTLLVMILQIMHGNTAIAHLRHLSTLSFTSSSFCKARIRLPLAIIEYVCQHISSEISYHGEEAACWKGHRIWYADGTSCSMPDTKALQDAFGQPGGQKPGCGFPVSTLMVLCDAAGFILKTIAMPLRTHDASQIHKLYDQFEAGDILVYDRAGCSFVNFVLLKASDLQGIVRVHQKQIVNFRSGRKHAALFPKGKRKGKPTSRWIKRLGVFDQVVEWLKPDRRPSRMTQAEYDALPDAVTLRELCYKINRKGFRPKQVVLVTTLLDPVKYTAQALAEKYLDRWDIEVNFRHLKTTMKMDVLKCKTVDGVLKELAVFVLVYNMVRLVMLRAAQQQKMPLGRISFIDALRWLTSHRDSGDLIPLVVNPKRPDRIEPRAVKRRGKSYPRLTKPRAEMRNDLEKRRKVA